jgi:hypothetical protein
MPEPFTTVAEAHEYGGLLIRLFEERVAELTQRLIDGEISLMDWHIGMRDELRKGNAYQLIAGANGEKDNVESDDWLKLGTRLRSEYGYLEDFARAIYNGELSAAQIEARVELYARSMQVVYWQQFTRDYDLPAMPGQGSECMGNCGCAWDIEVGAGVAYAYWRRAKADSCPTCLQREREWSPYVVALKEAA